MLLAYIVGVRWFGRDVPVRLSDRLQVLLGSFMSTTDSFSSGTSEGVEAFRLLNETLSEDGKFLKRTSAFRNTEGDVCIQIHTYKLFSIKMFVEPVDSDLADFFFEQKSSGLSSCPCTDEVQNRSPEKENNNNGKCLKRRNNENDINNKKYEAMNPVGSRPFPVDVQEMGPEREKGNIIENNGKQSRKFENEKKINNENYVPSKLRMSRSPPAEVQDNGPENEKKNSGTENERKMCKTDNEKNKKSEEGNMDLENKPVAENILKTYKEVLLSLDKGEDQAEKYGNDKKRTQTVPGKRRPEKRSENDRRVESANAGPTLVPEAPRSCHVPAGAVRVIPTPKNWRKRQGNISTNESGSPSTKERRKHFDEEATGLGPLKSLLNKISPKNFEKVSGQICAFLVENPARVETTAGVVTEFAIRQQFYARTYAQLCTLLLKKLPKESANAYRTHLGIQCKRLFEVSENLNIKGKNLNAEQELISIKNRKQYVGLCSYIASLCLEGIFESRRVAVCIRSLLRKGDEGSLEAVCALLETAGQKVDQSVKASPVGTQVVNSIYSSIKEIMEKKLTSSRMRYLLLDIVELRERGWKPRIPKEVPQCRK
ncbi:uncharacterized protein LOC143019532 [Oratosquilla oratoria]|uniref:uncharacterized protein LOC143019532 n=1 Tax=Oratosquilla oratoria TaxID=337810 RepID=UPI003F76628E